MVGGEGYVLLEAALINQAPSRPRTLDVKVEIREPYFCGYMVRVHPTFEDVSRVTMLLI